MKFIYGTSQILLTLSLVSIVSTKDLTEESEWSNWYRKLQDPTFECSPEDESRLGPIVWENVDCDSPGARFDYNFKSNKSGQKPVKVFNGKGRITFSNGNEQGTFNHGFKYGKCLKPFSSDVKSISGKFTKDSLEGTVRIEFNNGFFVIGHATSNHFVGVLRYFDESIKLQNITEAFTGKTFWSYENEIYVSKSTDNPNRAFLTQDFKEILDCYQADSVHFINCIEIVRPIIPSNPSTSCEAILQTNKLQCHSLKDESTSQNLFKWNSRLKQKTSSEISYPECPTQDEWNTDNIRHSIEGWRASIYLNEEYPWSHFEDSEPFESDNPRIFVTLDLFVNRKSHFLQNVTFRSFDRYLFSTVMKNGTIDTSVPPAVAQLPDWRVPIFIVISDDVASVPGISLEPLGKKLKHYKYVVHGKLKNGRLHGHVTTHGVMATDPQCKCHDKIVTGLGFVGMFHEGVPFGICWRELIGGSWIYGKVNEQGLFTGDNIAYVYQDLKTALVGKFERGLMVEGRVAEVIAEKCGDNGIKLLKFSEPSGPVYHYNPSTNESLGDQPLLGDPIDNRYILLKNSEIYPLAGEGAHAKEYVPPNTVFSVYGGHVLDRDEHNNLLKTLSKIHSENKLKSSSQEVYDSWKYRHTIAVCDLVIDIPPQYEPVSKYCGTLGHKVNHAFLPNSHYISFESPRFGIINAVMTNDKPIVEGQEFLASYGYSFESGPAWYQKLYLDFIKAHPDSKHIINYYSKDRTEEELLKVHEKTLEGVLISLSTNMTDTTAREIPKSSEE